MCACPPMHHSIFCGARLTSQRCGQAHRPQAGKDFILRLVGDERLAKPGSGALIGHPCGQRRQYESVCCVRPYPSAGRIRNHQPPSGASGGLSESGGDVFPRRSDGALNRKRKPLTKVLLECRGAQRCKPRQNGYLTGPRSAPAAKCGGAHLVSFTAHSASPAGPLARSHGTRGRSWQRMQGCGSGCCATRTGSSVLCKWCVSKRNG